MTLIQLAVLIYEENKKKVYSILLKLNNGERYTLIYRTLDFTVKVANRIGIYRGKK